MINLKSWLLFLFCSSFVAVFTSQTAVDLFDILMVLTALFTSYKLRDLNSLFTNFKPAWIWPLWVLILTIGMVINVGFQDLKAWGDFFEFRWIITYLSILYLASKIDINDQFMRTISWILLILNIVALLLFVQDSHWRVQGIMKATMAFSHNIAPLFCLFGIYLLTRWNYLNTQNKALFSMVVISSGLLTLLTFTRGVWIGSVVGILVALFCWNKKRALYFVGIGIMMSLVLLVSNQRVYERVFGKTKNETQSDSERVALWRGNWAMIQEYPIFGVGVGQNKKLLRGYYNEMGYPKGQRESHAHNQYLQLWAGTGIFGIILFLFFNGLILSKTKDSLENLKDHSKAIQLGLLAAIFCFMIGGLTESNFNIAKNRFLFLILSGLAVSQSLKYNRKYLD